jgi:hypothetical protein
VKNDCLVEVTKMITVLNYLKIPKLMDVYCAMLLTKFTTVGRTVKDVNQDLASRY